MKHGEPDACAQRLGGHLDQVSVRIQEPPQLVWFSFEAIQGGDECRVQQAEGGHCQRQAGRSWNCVPDLSGGDVRESQHAGADDVLRRPPFLVDLARGPLSY